MKNDILNIVDIKINEKIYPRHSINESIVKEYAKQMDRGKIFPDIYVALFKKQYILIDGRHRVEANKQLGRKHIKADINDKFSDISEILVASFRANEKHGLRMNQADKLKVAYNMRDMEFDAEQITELTGITLGRFNKTVLGKFRKDVITRKIKGGKAPRILSETVKQTEEKGDLVSKEEEARLAKEYKREWHLDELGRIYEYLKSENFDMDDRKIGKAISKIKKLLHKRFPKL